MDAVQPAPGLAVLHPEYRNEMSKRHRKPVSGEYFCFADRYSQCCHYRRRDACDIRCSPRYLYVTRRQKDSSRNTTSG